MATKRKAVPGKLARMSASTPLLTPLVSGLAGALVTYGLARLAARPAMPDRHGWRHVRAGPMHWTGCVLAGGLVGLMGYVGLFVGSSRPDAAFQMQVLNGLLLAFTLGCGACLWQMHRIGRAAVSFRGRQIAYCDKRGTRAVRRFDEVAEMRNTLLSGVIVRFEDGATVRLDPHATGTADLCERIMASSES
jgi:ABC-type Fe3+ transport system permease subunit